MSIVIESKKVSNFLSMLDTRRRVAGRLSLVPKLVEELRQSKGRAA